MAASCQYGSAPMTQTSNRFYDQFARLMNDAASVAQGVRREASSLFRSQAERLVSDMDLVRREDFEVVREMAVKAREENEVLRARLEALEARLGVAPTAPAASAEAPRAGARSRRTATPTGETT
jgi:BMFP domain-containing protein YqiC